MSIASCIPVVNTVYVRTYRSSHEVFNWQNALGVVVFNTRASTLHETKALDNYTVESFFQDTKNEYFLPKF